MKSLADIQRLMAQSVMRPLTGEDRMQTVWVDGQRTEDVAASFIKPNDRLSSFERLEIYNRQYWFRILDCLYEDYPGLRAVLGDKRFHALARAYLDRHPSVSFTLRDLGSRLAEFLQAEPHWVAPYERLALDMARLEWAQIEAFDGEAKNITNFEELANVSPEQIKLRLQPYITLLDLAYPADAMLLRIIRKENGLRSEASNAVDRSERSTRCSQAWRVKPERIWLAVHRIDTFVYFKRMKEVEFHVLQAIAECDDLGTIVDKVESIGMQSEDLRRSFENWSALGWLWI